MVVNNLKRLLLKILKKGLFIGPFFFFLILNLETNLVPNAQKFLAIFSWVVSGWLFTRVPLFITGIFGVCLSIIMGVATTQEAFGPFSNQIIFLFMGGFLIAKALEVLRFDRKIALNILTLPLIAGNFKRTIMAIYIVTAFFSMWVSNTATTAMMLPIVLGILNNLHLEDEKLKSTVLLGVAYSATIGGIGTPLGSPPNLIALGFLETLVNIKIGFFQWFLFGFPLEVLFLIILYLYTIRKVPNTLERYNTEALLEEKKMLPPINRHEMVVMFIFASAVTLWFSPSLLPLIIGKGHPLVSFFKTNMPAGVVSIFLASLLFMLPITERVKILGLDDAKSIDWPSLFLFGSGLSLGGILFKTGLAEAFSNALFSGVTSESFIYILCFLVFVTIFTTELASNTASANILVPLVIVASTKAGFSPKIAAIAVALACNMAFMLPVATPPNTIIYGSGNVKLIDMVKEGFGLNLLAFVFLAVVILIISFFL
ncbi:SLC13 family permease [Halobacteriovorax sp. GB3]|uniref:SLC13 family permease n=1 Tax=Halobacteriovorax sp. GB3 TaxID=2719615 RepID=UPI00235DEB8E|nr:SLC13 family permease [Halobacteriovorax sp. GB3]MDD0854164.1 SLC13 family permease [Halobacteriovorax sp. GB3]